MCFSRRGNGVTVPRFLVGRGRPKPARVSGDCCSKNLAHRSKSAGFTIIEMLVVLVVVSFILAIAVTNLNSARRRQRDAQRNANVDQLSKGLELYYNENNGKYPADCNDVVISDSAVCRAELNPYFSTIDRIKDPYPGVLAGCTDTSSAPCDYKFGMVDSTYTLYFYLEYPHPLTQSQCNKLTPSGVSACL